MGLKQHQKSIGNFIKLNLFDVVSIVSGFNQSKICLRSNLQHAQISFQIDLLQHVEGNFKKCVYVLLERDYYLI